MVTSHPVRPTTHLNIACIVAAVTSLIRVDVGSCEELSVSGSAAVGSLTARDTVETRQILYPFWFWSHKNPVQTSPNSNRYVFVTERGDLEQDGKSIEFFSGRTDSLDSARQSRYVARFFSNAKSVNSLRFDPVQWFENGRKIAFLWKEEGHRQVVSVDLDSGEVKILTRSETDIVAFGVDDSGETLVYAADPLPADKASLEMVENGFAVSDQEITQIINARPAQADAYMEPHFWVQRKRGTPVRVTVGSRRTLTPPFISVSPRGAFALVTAPPESFPKSWATYDANSPYLLGLAGMREQDRAPTDISQFWLMDTKAATARPLFNAPRSRPPLVSVVWSADESRLLVGPTFLPPDASSLSGRMGTAIAEVDVQTRKYFELPLQLQSDTFIPRRWHSHDAAVLEGPNSLAIFHKSRSKWRIKERVRKEIESPTAIEIRNDLNTPPTLYAVDRVSGHTVKLLDVNAELQQETLGRVESFRWGDVKNRSWTGTLHFPVGYSPAKAAVPLVVQLSGAPVSVHTFSLLGFDIPTAYAAQPLANRGIAVLNVHHPDGGISAEEVSPREPQIIQEGVEAAIGRLIELGIADRRKVGLLGFSRAGWHALYILTHSTFPYAAANVSDNIDASYLQYTIGTFAYQSEMERNIGAPPFGDGLQAWVDQAPGFRTHLIQAPLRLERAQAGEWGMAIALASWEIFSRMRQMRQPVELFIVPQVTEAQHQLEGPRQQLASREGTVEWFDFWLNDQESSSIKPEQYQRWRALKVQHKTWLEQMSRAHSAPSVATRPDSSATAPFDR